MSLVLLLYAVAIGALVSAAATAAASAAGYVKRPTRWIWVAAMVATAALPFLPRSAAPSPTAATPVAVEIVPVRALSQFMGSASAALPQNAGDPVPWILILWGVTSFVTATLLALGIHRVRSQSRRWRSDQLDGDTIWISDGFGPAVVGFLRPEVVLPDWTLRLEPRDRGMILLHENEHRRARDPLLLALGAACLVVTPWNPFAWIQFRGLRRAIEFDCDRRVLARGAAPRAYGRLLLSLQQRDGRGALLAPALRESASFLERRLKMMTLRDRPIPRGRVAVLVACAVLLGVVACETPKPVGPEPIEAPAPSAITLAEGSRTAPVEALRRIERSADGGEIVYEIDGETFDELPTDLDLDRFSRFEASSSLSGDGPLRIRLIGEDEDRSGTVRALRVSDIDPDAECPGKMRAVRSAEGVIVTGCPRSTSDDRANDVPTLMETTPNPECESGLMGTSTGSRGLRVRGCVKPEATGNSVELVRGEDGVVRFVNEFNERTDRRPLVYVDGVRIGPNGERSGLTMSPADIDRIEVIKGEAAEELYGADARNGIIQIFTKDHAARGERGGNGR